MFVFSIVKVKADDESEIKFFAKGIPKDYEDLEENEAFQMFSNLLFDNKELRVEVRSCRYGKTNEYHDATKEELNYVIHNWNEIVNSSTFAWIDSNSYSFDFDTEELFMDRILGGG